MARRSGRPFLVVIALLAPALAGCFTSVETNLGDGPPDFRGVTVSSNALAAQAGASILSAGGNAIDAAAAIQFALTVVEPQYSGIGGGAFILVRNGTTGLSFILDGRETAPAASTPDQFLTESGEAQDHWTAHQEGYAVGVPGTVRVWAEAVAHHGRLSLADVMAPAIALAADGFRVDAVLAGFLADPRMSEKLKSWPPTAQVFYREVVCPTALAPPPLHDAVTCTGGTPLAEGQTLFRPDLARTLSLIASQGPDVFYNGAIAEAIVATVAERDGRMTTRDLAAYAVREREPLQASYRGVDILTMPPPGGGVVVAQLLALIEGFDVARSGANTADTLHLAVEAMHLAYADRGAFLGDEDVVDVPVAGMLHPDYIAKRRALIDPGKAAVRVAPGDPWAYDPNGRDPGTRGAAAATEGHHTSHFIAIDADGTIVSATGTIEQVFGSGLMVPEWGIMLNNELTDFDFMPGGPNQVEGGKRPRSSMSPTILLRDGIPVATFGAAGGPTIITSVFQVAMNLVDHGMTAADASAAGRLYSPVPGRTGGDITWERTIPKAVINDLRARGHDPEPAGVQGISALQLAVRNPDGSWTGMSDPRRGAGGVGLVMPTP